MATIKKAQLGGLIKKGVKAATEAAPKVSKWDYPTQEKRDFQRAMLEAYPEKIKKMPKGNNKIDKVKKVKPSYDKNGLEILKDKHGGSIKKAQSGAKVPASKTKQNIKDATQMKNIRPTGPSTGRVKPKTGKA